MTAAAPLRIAPVPAVPPVASEALVEAMADGDPEALGLLFDRYHRAVYGFLAAACRVDVADLDDLVQDTFLCAYKAARRFQRLSVVKTWLFGIGLNLARNHARARRTRRQSADRLAPPTDSPMPPDRCVAARQELAQLDAAIAMLPEQLRVAYVMCVIEGVSGDDVARIVGVPKGTVWRRVHDARERLRLHVGRDLP